MLGENLEADRAYIWLFLTEPVGSGNLFAAQMYEWSRNPEFRQEGEQGAHVHAASARPNCEHVPQRARLSRLLARSASR